MPQRGGAWSTAVLMIVLTVASLAVSPESAGESPPPDPTAIAPICPGITASSPQTLSLTPPPVPLSPCPGVVMGTFLGGSSGESATDVAVDATGNIYVTGATASADFPTTSGAYDTTFNGYLDVFLARFDPTGVLLYSTFLGGTSNDGDPSTSVSLDSFGNVYVAGTTESYDFPVTQGAFDTAPKNVFVAKFDPTGALVYSTFLGGSGGESHASMVVDTSGNAYVTGSTGSRDFPVTDGVFMSSSESNDGSLQDVFVAKLNPDGTGLVYSTVIGGEGADVEPSIAVDGVGNVYVTGTTFSQDFPVTSHAFDRNFNLPCPQDISTDCNLSDAFLFKLNPDATALVYSTFLGGDLHQEWAYGIAADYAGNAHVTGTTFSPDFPVTPGAFDTTSCDFSRTFRCDFMEIFLAGFDPSGELVYATFLGTRRPAFVDDAGGLFLDDTGGVYLTGDTQANLPTDFAFPTSLGTYDATLNGGFTDAFVAKLDSRGSTLVYSTFLGGGDEVLLGDPPPVGTQAWWPRESVAGMDTGISIAVDPSGNATVVGVTASPDFPATGEGFDSTFNGWVDAFVIRMELIPEPNRAPTAYFEVLPSSENVRQVTVNASNSADAEDSDGLLEVRWDWENDVTWDTEWSAVKVASHEYPAPGTYAIRLEVRDIGGLTSSVVREVTVVGPPVPLSVQALAAPTSGIVPLTVSFTSTVAGGLGPYAYVWTFGDGVTSESPNPIHTFEIPSTYTVTLTVRDAQGRSISESIQVVVTGPAVETSDTGIPSWAAYVVAAAIAVSVVGVLLSLWRSRKAGPPR